MKKNTQQPSGDKSLQQFFKVFLSQTSSTQLRIPRAFNKFLNGITTNEVTLMDHENNSWDIDMARIEDTFIFENGWQQFAKEKCLEEGEFLVFEYDGKSTFYVKIFSKSGCRKEFETCNKVVPIVNMDEGCDQICQKNKRGRKRKHSSIGLQINEKSNLEGPSKVAKKSKPTIANGANGEGYNKKHSTDSSKCAPPNNPHFIVHFSSTTKLKRVEIHKTILRKWDMKLRSTLSLKNENGKVWLVKISTTLDGRYYLGIGLSDFVKSNNIRKGNQCEFEFVIGERNVVKEILVHAPK
ncbi:hypothetical protein TanjilG_22641 [Lupinus angustifolius]|uniref:TF-B3 domain-containing protein n=1 Tax=Lupinus angustifolius TaxID=3871 RepID=A0A4P1RT79_LUPAN|nr:PREDICTED: putative B3 domain-containing protein At5g66980 [Lupinus angustifolius]OIW17529.1 hypothetical protein TanjilG_22641 [Lupinus angustifolius]